MPAHFLLPAIFHEFTENSYLLTSSQPPFFCTSVGWLGLSVDGSLFQWRLTKKGHKSSLQSLVSRTRSLRSAVTLSWFCATFLNCKRCSQCSRARNTYFTHQIIQDTSLLLTAALAARPPLCAMQSSSKTQLSDFHVLLKTTAPAHEKSTSFTTTTENVKIS